MSVKNIISISIAAAVITGALKPASAEEALTEQNATFRVTCSDNPAKPTYIVSESDFSGDEFKGTTKSQFIVARQHLPTCAGMLMVEPTNASDSFDTPEDSAIAHRTKGAAYGTVTVSVIRGMPDKNVPSNIDGVAAFKTAIHSAEGDDICGVQLASRRALFIRVISGRCTGRLTP